MRMIPRNSVASGPGLALVAALLLGGCDFLWPLDGKYDPRRCRCAAADDCIDGVCVPRPDAARPDGALDAPGLDVQEVDAGVDAGPDLSPPDAFVPPGARVKIVVGTFYMGAPPGEPCLPKINESYHQVKLTRNFEMSTTEVTQGQFKQILGYNPSKSANPSGKICGDACPVENVRWHEAAAYCNALSKGAGLTPCYTCQGAKQLALCYVSPAYKGSAIYGCPGYRLPTEAEWEYAARAGSLTSLYVSKSCDGTISSCLGVDANTNHISWNLNNSLGVIHEVAKKECNAWGLCDMLGNVEEWCHDWYQSDPGTAPVVDPVGNGSMQMNVRGGSVDHLAKDLRLARRWSNEKSLPYGGLGFRWVRKVSTP